MGGPVAVVDPVPVEVHVVEFVGSDGFADEVEGAVCGEADEADAAVGLEFACGFEGAAGAEGEVEEFLVVDAVDGEEVDVVDFEEGEGGFDVFEEIGFGGFGATLVWRMN